jgi:hypothetical protein
MRGGLAYRMCRGKWRYRDEADARSMLASIRRRRGDGPLRPYECPLCLGWHLSSKPEHQERQG